MGSCTSVNTGEYKGEYPNFQLQVTSKISGDPDKCLFDYQYNNSTEHKDKISSCEAIVKTNCFLHAMQSELSENANEPKKTASVHDRMLAFCFTQGKFWVHNGKQFDNDLTWENVKDRAWIVLTKINRCKQSQVVSKERYKLSTGDVIRFGRVVFKVTIVSKNSKKSQSDSHEKFYDIVDKPRSTKKKDDQWTSSKTVMPLVEDNQNPARGKSRFGKAKEDPIYHRYEESEIDDSDRPSEISESANVKKPEEDGELVCRICYGKEDEPEVDPLIVPCKCTGSVKHIHLSCAKAWINEEMTQDIGENVKSYCWERISCELCNGPFKEVVEKDGKEYKIFEKEKINSDTYMVLESIFPDFIKIYYGITIDNENKTKTFDLGRSRNCDIKLNLDSISRAHAQFIYEKGNFYLRDVNSTFGTMALLRHPLCFNKKKKDEVAIQAGPTLIEIRHGGNKKVEHTYINKEGQQKKCAVYQEFKHKIPSDMRTYIDAHLDVCDIIRAEEVRKPSVLYTRDEECKMPTTPRSNKNISYPKMSIQQRQIQSTNNIPMRRVPEDLKEEDSQNVSNNHLKVPRFSQPGLIPQTSNGSDIMRSNSGSSVSAGNRGDNSSDDSPSSSDNDVNEIIREVCSDSIEEEKSNTNARQKHSDNTLTNKTSHDTRPREGRNSYGNVQNTQEEEYGHASLEAR